jgi:hypothetical protein
MMRCRALGEPQVGIVHTVFIHLARDQEAVRDGHLFFFDVTGELDHFQPVQQRLGDGVEHVGGGDEHHLGEVEGYFQVMVTE